VPVKKIKILKYNMSLTLSPSLTSSTDIISSRDSSKELHKMVDDVVDRMQNIVDWIPDSSPEELSELNRYYKLVEGFVFEKRYEFSQVIEKFIDIIDSRPRLEQAGGSIPMGMLAARIARREKNERRAKYRKQAYEKKKAEDRVVDELHAVSIQQNMSPNLPDYGPKPLPTSYSVTQQQFIQDQRIAEYHRQLKEDADFARVSDNTGRLTFFLGIILPFLIIIMYTILKHPPVYGGKGGKSRKMGRRNKTVKKRCKL